VVEEAALQRVFQHVFAEEARRRQLSQFINKIEGVKPSEWGGDKVTLARAVQPMWTRGQVHIDRGKTPQLYNKLEDYPRQGTDDVNALLIALWFLQQGWVGRMTKRKERQKARATAPVGHFGQAVRGVA
jgi:phage terminase large subunit-like protein